MQQMQKGFYPICFIEKNVLLGFKRRKFYKLDLLSGKKKIILEMPDSFIVRIISQFRILSRIMRLGIRCGIKISDNLVLVVVENKIKELDLENGTISDGYFSRDGSRPLIFSSIEGITGFDNGIYFGGYLVNPTKKPVSIYKRIKRDEWLEVYQFEEGAIEHIHNIVSDKYNNSVFIFTGDFNKSSAIWIAKDNFRSVTPILQEHPHYRACVAYPTENGVIYATDTPFYKNSIRLLKKSENSEWISEHVESINGPSIYGCNWKSDLLFSTSVEGDGGNHSLLYKLFGRRLGKGVSDRFSYIYKGNLKDGFKVLYKAKKDFLPFYLFQFGVLVFPNGENESDILPIYHIATQKCDMSTIYLNE